MGRLGVEVVDKGEPVAEIAWTRRPGQDRDPAAADNCAAARAVLDQPRAIETGLQRMFDPAAETVATAASSIATRMSENIAIRW